MKLRKSKALWYGVTTVIFTVLIYFADVGQFLEAIGTVNRFFMAIAMVSGLSFFLFVSYVWHRVFRQVGIETTYFKSLKLFLAGNFMNSITPLGQFGGEPFMAYVVSKNTGSSYEKSLSCVISADLINAVPLVTYLAAGLIYLLVFNTLRNFALQILYIAVPTFIIGGLIVYLLWFEEDILEDFAFRILDGLEKHLQRGEKYVDSVKKRVTEIKASFQTVGENPRHLAKTLIVPHIGFLTQFVSLYFILLGQGVEPLVIPTFFTMILSTIATFSPTPGGSGTFETAFSGLLIFFYPIGLDTALASAVLFRLTTYWPGILIGYISLLSLRREKK